MLSLRFAAGTLELSAWPPGVPLPSRLSRDERTNTFRAPASAYREVIECLVRGNVEYQDEARAYGELATGLVVHREPRPYQSEALSAWRNAGGRGVIVLPTGAGKTEVAMMALDDRRRDTLVVAPTLDLVRQWRDRLAVTFATTVGVVGGGDHDVRPLTVTTYDSAHLHMEHLGGRFGLLIFDECHHLPGASYTLAAHLSLAPYRMGLTATPERGDGREKDLDALIGPVVYRKDIVELSGRYLADYATRRVVIDLAPAERQAHDEARAEYVGFLRAQGIDMSRTDGWSQFIIRASRTDEGRSALKAYRRQRELAFTAPAKLEYLEHLLATHSRDRMLIFTQDNATCHKVASRFLIPAITHNTRVSERSAILTGLGSGRYGAVATSRVLNEGVDIPDANVAVILSGSGSVREHVQRLGRILRKRDSKHALLYELVTGATSETRTSERRREHSAYR